MMGHTTVKTAIVVLTLGIMTACLAASGPAEVSTSLEFKEVVTPVGTGPGSIAVADLNRDG